MSKRKETPAPALMGIGVPDESGIPVTYLVGGRPLVMFVQGLHSSEVRFEDGQEEVDSDVARHAIKVLSEIVEIWLGWRDYCVSQALRRMDTTVSTTDGVVK